MSSVLAILRGVPLFSELGDDDLARIAERARLEDLPAGTVLIAEASPPAAMFVIVDGEFAIEKRTSGKPMLLNTCGPGDLLGELSVLENRPRTASVTARTAGRVVALDVAALHDLLRGSLGATLAILRTIATRLGNTEAVLRQHDTLAGLGRIAAGLAHELNNPAAAIKRGAVELPERLGVLETASFALRGLDDAQLATVRSLADPEARVTVESAMQRARREQALEAALDDRGVANAWELAPTLCALGWETTTIDRAVAAGSDLAATLRWVVATASTRSIARDIGDAATRISDLVGAVKSNSHLGEAPVQAVDLHAGLDSTLALFRHKLGDIAVRRDYTELPKIDAHGSELNQVWTNLIDNAIHAMAGKGELLVSTRRDGDHVIVEIVDSGSGIPPELQSEIWKPFFTTKGVGEGTGLGLHLAHNVVARRHRGRIELESRPGRTCFRVTLPISEP